MLATVFTATTSRSKYNMYVVQGQMRESLYTVGQRSLFGGKNTLYVCIAYISVVYCTQSLYIKLQQTLFNAVMWPWIHFPAAAIRWMSSLWKVHLTVPLCLPPLQSRCRDMPSGSGRRGQMEPAWVRGGGFWFHYQLIKLQQPSVAQFPLEPGKSILLCQFGGKVSQL